jgi:hypothetical protein
MEFTLESIPSDESLKEIWKLKCLPKLSVCAWLLMMDILNTKDMMLRKKMAS